MTSYWSYLIISAAVILCAVLIYLLLRWRNARRAFTAMSLVATACLAAGVLIGIWSMHAIDAWMHAAGTSAASNPEGATRAPEASSLPRTPARETTPSVSPASSAASPDGKSVIVGSYVGQALAQKYAKDATTGRIEEWPQVDQGCRLGNYDRTSAFCRAAELAVHGWGETRAIPLDGVAEFCNAQYLQATLALCLTTTRGFGRPVHSGPTERIPGTEVDGIPEADVVEGLKWRFTLAAYGPDGKWKTWNELSSLCARGVYASESPACEAAAIREHGAGGSVRVPYLEVASFCDVTLMNADTEVCRAAYRFAQSNRDSAR
jgi:hypothetical protein